MTEYWIGIASAFWFGVLTSISPCPLATNIAAISFIGRKGDKVRSVLSAGVLYSLGRMFTYISLGLLIVMGLFAVPSLSFFLQKQINIVLGPMLIIVGMFLVELIEFNFRGSRIAEKLQNSFKDGSITSNFFLGAIFALAFCPVSAALFFGSLIPISLRLNAPIFPFASYGLGTALPVFVVAFVLAVGSHSISSIFNKITTFDKWARLFTGWLIIVIGIYLTLKDIFKLY
jgi:cytochrome c-type biogenesis protein